MNYSEEAEETFLKQGVGVFFPFRHERNWKGEPRALDSKFYFMINETINNKLIVITVDRVLGAGIIYGMLAII